MNIKLKLFMVRLQVAYKETIQKAAKLKVNSFKQSGGRGQYGHVWIEV